MFADRGKERVKSRGWLKTEANPFFHIFITTDSEYYGFIPWVHTAEKPICRALPAQCWRGSQPGRNTRRWGEAATTFFGAKTPVFVHYIILIPSSYSFLRLGRIFSFSYYVKNITLFHKKQPRVRRCPRFAGCSVTPLWLLASPILTGVSSLSFTLSRCHVTVSVSQSVAVSNPKQVQLIHGKNASSPTSPTSLTSPSGSAGGAATWTDNKGAAKGSTLGAANPEAGKDLFNMKPWVTFQYRSAQCQVQTQTWTKDLG